jgi:hypothetical protein
VGQAPLDDQGLDLFDAGAGDGDRLQGDRGGADRAGSGDDGAGEVAGLEPQAQTDSVLGGQDHDTGPGIDHDPHGARTLVGIDEGVGPVVTVGGLEHLAGRARGGGMDGGGRGRPGLSPRLGMVQPPGRAQGRGHGKGHDSDRGEVETHTPSVVNTPLLQPLPCRTRRLGWGERGWFAER